MHAYFFVRGLVIAAIAAIAMPLHAAPGDFDTTFGSGDGKVPSIVVNSRGNFMNRVAIQPDGKIVIAGTCIEVGFDGRFCVVRLNEDGSLDTSFVGPEGNGDGKFSFTISSKSSSAVGLALQPDGKILLAGSCLNTGDPIPHMCVARLNANGSFDTSFVGPSGAGNGRVELAVAQFGDFPGDVALQPDGKIVLGGSCFVAGPGMDSCVVRLNPDGSFDAGFAPTSPLGVGRFAFKITPNENTINAVKLQADGKIIVAGGCTDTNVLFCVARVNVNGTLDTFFSFDGKLSFSIGSVADRIRSVTLQPDGKIILGGTCDGATASDHRMCIARLSSIGFLDSTFDGPDALSPGNGKFKLTTQASNIRSTAIQPDGKIVLVGSCNTIKWFVCVVRLDNEGRFDLSLDGASGPGDGQLLLDVSGSFDYGQALALQSNGKIVIAAQCIGVVMNICATRLNGGPFGYQRCTPDIDGDGRMTATVDALINTRVMLGLTGSAVTRGITFPADATRNSWSEIRTYLVTQCGMTIAP
jgi:uncharacterized delta-60 repeat protein